MAAAAVFATVLAWPTSSASPAQVREPFTDRAGLVVFEQLPSGRLGTAAPDGSHSVILSKVGALQGYDLPVASSDGHYLVDIEGQLVTMGRAGPVSISNLDQPAGAQTSGSSWQDASFADSGKYVEATECYASSSGFNQSFVADLMPTAGGPDHMLGTVTDSAADPTSAGAVETVPVSVSSATSPAACSGLPVPDKAIEQLQPGQAPRTIVTAADLDRALSLAPGTPLTMSVKPNPSGTWLAVTVTVGAPQTPTAYQTARVETVVVTRAGKVVADSPPLSHTWSWSPEGRKIAYCQLLRQRGSSASVSIWTVGGASRTIVLPGRHDLECDQLLWSPDGSQLLYSAYVNHTGLTEADRLQHGWTVIDLRTGRVHDVSAPGQPAAWLPATAGAAG